jgi:hypothetical protein
VVEAQQLTRVKNLYDSADIKHQLDSVAVEVRACVAADRASCGGAQNDSKTIPRSGCRRACVRGDRATGHRSRRRRYRHRHRPPNSLLSPNTLNHRQVVQDAGYDEDYLISNVKITLGVMA